MQFCAIKPHAIFLPGSTPIFVAKGSTVMSCGLAGSRQGRIWVNEPETDEVEEVHIFAIRTGWRVACAAIAHSRYIGVIEVADLETYHIFEVRPPGTGEPERPH